MQNFHFGENLRRIRRAKDISQEAMALKLNISQTKYFRIESQSTIPDENLVAEMAKILEVPVTDLIPSNAKPALPVIQREHKTKEIINTPFGTLFIIVAAVTLVSAAYQLATEVCIYNNTSDQTTIISQRSAGLLMGGYIWYWVRKIKKSK